MSVNFFFSDIKVRTLTEDRVPRENLRIEQGGNDMRLDAGTQSF
jgi:hypothetical protein